MKKYLALIVIVLISLSSCNEDDPTIKPDEDYLVGTWTIKKIKTYHYLNGELDNMEESIYTEPYSTLKFDIDKTVTYSNPDFTETIIGTWDLDQKILKTDLKLELRSSSGYSMFYFFPENTISLLNETELVLKTPMSLKVGSTTENKTEYYSETYLEK